MDIDFDKLHLILKENLKPRRYKHVLGVRDTALMLAEKYGADKTKCEIAALFHDYAKDFNREKMKEIIDKYNIPMDSVEQKVFQLQHARVARYICENEYGIKDMEILNAIENHTTGRENMCLIEKIVLLADYMEPNRDFKGVEKIRELSKVSLDKAIICALSQTIDYLLELNELIHLETIKSRNYLMLNLK